MKIFLELIRTLQYLPEKDQVSILQKLSLEAILLLGDNKNENILQEARDIALDLRKYHEKGEKR